jgi:hypothetical protein
MISFNEGAIQIPKLLIENKDKIIHKYFFQTLSRTPDKHVIKYLYRHPNEIDWSNLSQNEKAIGILRKHPEKIDWKKLSRNKNAISMLKKNVDKIDWKQLKTNKNAYYIIKDNMDKYAGKYHQLLDYRDMRVIQLGLRQLSAQMDEINK